MKRKFNYRLYTLTAGLMFLAFLLFDQNSIAQKNLPKSNPDIHIYVNKKTDKNGNITQYDSTYSYSWSGGNHMPSNLDSIMKSFNERFSFGNDQFLHSFNDSTYAFSNDFENIDSLFSQNSGKMEFNWFSDKQFEKMMKEHQALIEQFFKHSQFNQEPALKVPDDIPPSAPEPKATPKKQNYVPATDL